MKGVRLIIFMEILIDNNLNNHAGLLTICMGETMCSSILYDLGRQAGLRDEFYRGGEFWFMPIPDYSQIK
jgi:hypothetical protein